MELLALLGMEAWSLGSCISYVLPFLFLLLVVLLKLYGEGSDIWTLQSCPVDLTGKTAVVTGANSGIGKAVSCELARRGARVVLACRRLPQGQKALEDIRKVTGSKELVLRELDLSSVASIQSFSQKLLQEERHIHLLVNNAGASGLPYKTITSDGLELTFMTNYLGHFLLTNLLLKGLLGAGSARVVNVSSFRHKHGFVDEQHLVGAGCPLLSNQPYDCSKLLLILFTRELAQRLQKTGVTVNSVDPGIVKTEIMKNHNWLYRSIFWFLSVFLKLYGEGSDIWTLQSCPVDLTGKTAVVTGANSGIGKAVSCELARRGARVVLACRRLPQGQKALEDIRKVTGSKELVLRELDLSSVASIQSFSQKLLQEERHIHLLVNNAGASGLPYKTITSDGLELTFMTNYLGHFLLTNLLLKGLLGAGSARVVNVSSFRHKHGFVDEQHLVGAGCPLLSNQPYDCSKLLLILFTRELAQRLQKTGVTVNSVDPGIVKTEIMKNHNWLYRSIFWFLSVFLKSPAQGAIPVLYLSLAEELDGVSGKYFTSKCKLTLPAEPARDPEVAHSLWNTSARLTNLEKVSKRE
ncbi:retinol dehydrogenase 13-like isoform X2 [Trichosurus vulpecula]|uniref:retinol dehydrogenase 13-like isoform X2 n=1 Tax=Trichosurus vulpecula TaxID=9337 RepID=UPI00186ABC62|nr:retinol dehydrogenase 13-like isoform X2 [Trichosurus vulpecula]